MGQVALCGPSAALPAALHRVQPEPPDLWMSRGWFIPAESNLWDFRETMANSGSGEWWLYGEDQVKFYALHDAAPIYLVLPRDRAPAGVDPLDKST